MYFLFQWCQLGFARQDTDGQLLKGGRVRIARYVAKILMIGIYHNLDDCRPCLVETYLTDCCTSAKFLITFLFLFCFSPQFSRLSNISFTPSTELFVSHTVTLSAHQEKHASNCFLCGQEWEMHLDITAGPSSDAPLAFVI